MTIKAVTFDLWDTIVDDNSDEEKRKELGLRSKKEERRYQVWEALNKIEPIDLEAVQLAYDTAEAGFIVVWKECHINWTIDQRLRVVLNGLGREVPNDVLKDLVDKHGRMEVDVPPNAIDGIKEALAKLSTHYQLAIVSDAIVTPGAGLRDLLEHHGLKKFFSSFSFSDEVGRSKPHRSMFDKVASDLGIDVSEIVHIGDRDHNDVKGPHAIGAKAVLFTATRPDDRDITTADAICDSHHHLAAIIDGLAAH
ncbi:MAG: HAD family hydrolase [Rhodospirillaceae bacterium]|nr:HAD family hydrolase [Rhodospirillaceae bacterium]